MPDNNTNDSADLSREMTIARRAMRARILQNHDTEGEALACILAKMSLTQRRKIAVLA